MCGILAYIKTQLILSKFTSNLKKIYHRGPNDSKTKIFEMNDIMLGFNRLIVNDQSTNATNYIQPMTIDNNVWMICDGDIFNHNTLQQKYNITCNTNNSCEIILHLYSKLSFFNEVLSELDGEFAVVLFDHNKNKVFASRDRYGVRPLFFGQFNYTSGVGFGSELKSLCDFDHVRQVIPGIMMDIDTNKMTTIESSYKLYNTHLVYCKQNKYISYEDDICTQINKTLKKAVEKRLTSDGHVCCLLSGGLDSSLIAALVAKHYPAFTLKTFSIGFKGSPDLYYANIVANHIKSIHHYIELSEGDFLNNIEKTIKMIESYDTTTVRAGVGNMMVAQFIKNNTDCKVVFNGEYSDEICGGYKYLNNAPDPFSFDTECKRLLSDNFYFDGLRSDRCISGNGLEARVPFADNDFVELYHSIPPELRMPTPYRIEKLLLRKAFEHENLIPSKVLWRKKEAFSDGISKPEKSWHKTIQKYIDTLVSDTESLEFNNLSKEALYYKKIFDKMYFKYTDVIPYYWMPKWCGDIKDPSAREII
uniref:asparagine synthase (glutamine-hydrolyzing) n=1 Tax=viral metagenome TaxID=1070528 RepID=A0A6C0BQP1_9ZZZZ